MKKILQKITAAALAAATAVSLTACGGTSGGTVSSSAAPAASAGKLEKVTFVLDYTPNTNHTGIYVAQAKGYFKEQGLQVEIKQPPEDGAVSLVGSGGAQFGIAFQDTDIAPALTSATPVPITAVAALIQHNTSGIVSVKSKKITRPKEMVGHSYATWNTPTEKAMVKYIIDKDGGDGSKLKTVPAGDNSIAQIQTNADCAWIYYAWDGIASEVQGVPTNYFAFKDIDPVFDYYTPVLISNNDFLKQHPQTAKKFLSAVQKGYQDAMKDPTAAAETLIAQVPSLKGSENLVVKSQKWLATRYQADAKQWGYIDQSRWDAFYKWLYSKKLISKEIPAGTGFSDAYLPQ